MFDIIGIWLSNMYTKLETEAVETPTEVPTQEPTTVAEATTAEATTAEQVSTQARPHPNHHNQKYLAN